MILFISPAKTFRKTEMTTNQTPMFADETSLLLTKLKSMSVKTIEKKMKVSQKVADITYQYYQTFGKTSYPAIYTYFGHQFRHIKPESLSDSHINDMNHRLYIMDGLYGLIRPLDQISYYRLEMQDKSIRNLYRFWTTKITGYLKENHKDDIFINLASHEYGQIIKDLDQTYTIEFYQLKNDKLSIHSMEAKKLRGLMVNHIFSHQIDNLNDIYKIHIEGYKFNENLSKNKEIIFTKEVQ